MIVTHRTDDMSKLPPVHGAALPAKLKQATGPARPKLALLNVVRQHSDTGDLSTAPPEKSTCAVYFITYVKSQVQVLLFWDVHAACAWKNVCHDMLIQVRSSSALTAMEAPPSASTS